MTILLEDVNPNGNLRAIVEADERVCYLYITGEPNSTFSIRSVWVCNLTRAPQDLNDAAMKTGAPPMNPWPYCLRPEGKRPPLAADLRITWLPEGNGAALSEKGEVIAIIPPWSGERGFNGYARECAGEGPVAWALNQDNALIERFEEAERYWRTWESDGVWEKLRDNLCTKIRTELGASTDFYAIDGGQWPPKALLRIPRENSTALVTVGVCLRPQPNVERWVEDPAPLRRIELAALLPMSWPDEAVRRFGKYLSGQSQLPWQAFTWLGDGHTIPCDSWRNPAFRFAVLVSRHPEVGRLSLGEQFGDPVQALWFLPLTAEQQQRAVQRGTADVLDAQTLEQWLET